MLRPALILSASLLVLAACQPTAEEAPALEAETPPVMEETGASESPADAVEVVHDEDDHSEEDHDAESAEDDHEDHAEDDDNEHEDHAEDGHDDHDEHSDDDHDRDGAGEAHVHGLSELAVSVDGNTLSVSLEGALANFGLDESLRELDDATAYTDDLVAVIGGDCTRDGANASIRPIGDHGNLVIDLTYTCMPYAIAEAIEVTAFEAFSGFEEVDAVVLTDTGQSAGTLTATSPRLDLP